MTLKCTVFADQSVGSAKIFVHINEDEIDTIPVYEEVFSSDDENEPEDDEGDMKTNILSVFILNL